MTNPRAIAAYIVYLVCYDGVSLSDAFLNTNVADLNDASLIKELCFGTIRFWISLQAILKELLEKPLKTEDKDIECLLCIGLYQLIYMDIAQYAAVDETVTATRVLKKSWASKLVNKILRMMIEKQIKPKGITAEFSHPNWIIDKVKNAWPDDWENILNANNKKAPLFLRINKTKTTLEKFESLLQKNNIESQRVLNLPFALLLPTALSVEKIPGFLEGLFSVQDASGQKVVDYLDLRSDHVVLDACAAPGSKTTHILENYPDIKKLISVDISKARLAKIKENIKRLRLNNKNNELLAGNLENINDEFEPNTFDRVLLDAPCSATGVIHRHPDIKILRKKTDIPALALQQLKMLNTVWPLLKNGGKLLYTTCSILPDENSEVIKLFLENNPDVKALPLDTNWAKKCEYGQQVITGDHGRDGFYYALLQKQT
jgi:16S rRNA (cytosine967-C5)-methyltransferase